MNGYAIVFITREGDDERVNMNWGEFFTDKELARGKCEDLMEDVKTFSNEHLGIRHATLDVMLPVED